MSCICQDCGVPYKMDVNVSEYLWNFIRPDGSKGTAGLLCPTCIVTKLEKLIGYSAFELVEISPQREYYEGYN